MDEPKNVTGVRDMKIRFLGCGDAFGSGGRFNTCFLVERGPESFLIDCGASSMIAMRRFGIDPNAIGTILLSHLHGDHFGGLPFFILDAQFVSRRERPLVIAGPVGLAGRVRDLVEAMFPGSWDAMRPFPIEFVELPVGERASPDRTELAVTSFSALHPSGSPSLALRIECDGATVAFTGDSEWTDALVSAGRNADLLISECYCYDKTVPFHLNLMTLREKLPLIGARRTIVTHMSEDMLKHVDELGDIEPAEDGLAVVVAPALSRTIPAAEQPVARATP
jgi:ribonuclease BN (tRNA processing enzyme)